MSGNKKTGILEFINTNFKIDDIGGLENLKQWLLKRNNSWLGKAQKDYNLPAPKGVLVTGISGTGKSLTAKAISSMWQLPLLRLDMKEDSNLNEKLWLPLRSIMQWNVNPIVTLIVIVPVFIITFILAIILAIYEGMRLAIEDEKQLKKNEEKVYANKAKENILVKINFPKYIYVIGSIAVILSLFKLYKD